AAVLLATGWTIATASALLRPAILGILAVLSSFLSRELMSQMEAHHEARAASERWASLLSAVAEASRRMTLDRERVVEVALDAITELGFEGASLAALDETGGTYRVIGARGLPAAYTE